MHLFYKFWDDLLELKDNNVAHLLWATFLLSDPTNQVAQNPDNIFRCINFEDIYINMYVCKPDHSKSIY